MIVMIVLEDGKWFDDYPPPSSGSARGFFLFPSHHCLSPAGTAASLSKEEYF